MKKNFEIRVRVSAEEKEKIEHKAQELGVQPSVFLRMLGLSARITTKSL